MGAQVIPATGPCGPLAAAPNVTRRAANCGLLSGLLALPSWSLQGQAAHASLLQFPVTRLHNNYFVREPGSTFGTQLRRAYTCLCSQAASPPGLLLQ